MYHLKSEHRARDPQPARYRRHQSAGHVLRLTTDLRKRTDRPVDQAGVFFVRVGSFSYCFVLLPPPSTTTIVLSYYHGRSLSRTTAIARRQPLPPTRGFVLFFSSHPIVIIIVY